VNGVMAHARRLRDHDLARRTGVLAALVAVNSRMDFLLDHGAGEDVPEALRTLVRHRVLRTLPDTDDVGVRVLGGLFEAHGPRVCGGFWPRHPHVEGVTAMRRVLSYCSDDLLCYFLRDLVRAMWRYSEAQDDVAAVNTRDLRARTAETPP